MSADNIVICSEIREQVEESLERFRYALEKRGMKVRRNRCVNERETGITVSPELLLLLIYSHLTL